MPVCNLTLIALLWCCRKGRGSWVQERDLEIFRNATDGPLEGGEAASAEEKATVQVRDVSNSWGIYIQSWLAGHAASQQYRVVGLHWQHWRVVICWRR